MCFFSQTKWLQYLKNLTKQRRPFKTLCAKGLWETGLCRFFVIRKNGYCLQFFPTAMSASLWIDSAAGIEDEDFLRSFLRVGDTMVDVGANIGSLSVLASVIVGKSGRVVAIEPHPRTYKYLEANLHLNKVQNCHMINVAIGTENGVCLLSDMKGDDQNKIAKDGCGFEVPMRRLDDICSSLPHIHLLKVDTEGYESFVFQSATEVLSKTDCVYYESYEKNLTPNGVTVGDLVKILEQQRFMVFRKDRDAHFTRVDAHYHSEALENLIAVRDVSFLIERNGFLITSETSESDRVKR